MVPSCPSWPVATPATTMLCASIILPITPPELFAAAARIGFMPICWALTTCRLPKSTFDEVSEPVSATPSQPRSGEKNGKSAPVEAKARPIVESEPQYFVVKPSASMSAIVRSEIRTRFSVLRYVATSSPTPTFSQRPATMPARRRPVPVAERRFRLYFAPSGESAFATGGAFFTRLWSPGISKVGLKTPFSQFFTLGMPQAKTKTERTIHGIQASQASPALGPFLAAAPTERKLALAAAASDSRSPGKRHSLFGCHT